MEPTIGWIFTNVVLALLPIVINFVLIKILKIGIQWHQTLKDGELFIFSTTLSASSIGVAFSPSKLNKPLGSIVLWTLLLVLIISAVLFSFASLAKLKQERIPDEKLLARISIVCAIAASFFSYFMAFISGAV